MKKVLVTFPEKDIGPVFPIEAYKKLKSFAEVKVNPHSQRYNSREFLEASKDVDAVVTDWFTGADKKYFDELNNLEIFARCAEKIDNINLEAATQNNVFVTNVPQEYVFGCIQLTFGYMISLSTNLFFHDKNIHEKKNILETRKASFELPGEKIGIIGFGTLGKNIARKAHNWRMQVLTYDPYVEAPGLSAEMTSLTNLLKESRFVIIACKSTKETAGLISRKELKLMREDSFLINIARGAIVDEEALAKALENNVIAGAAIDVYSNEPDIKENPLLDAPNTILTPHIGGHTKEAYLAEGMGAVKSVEQIFNGVLPPNIVNPEVFESVVNNNQKWLTKNKN